MTTQNSIVISNNPHHFPGPGSQTFVLSPQNSFDDDILQAIYLDDCSSQWTLDTSVDSQQPVMGAHVCGGLGSGGSGFVIDYGGDGDLIACPRNYQFNVYYAGTLPGVSSCNVIITSIPANQGSAFELATLTMTGSGSGVSGITVSPSKIDFGDVQINTTTVPATVQVKNNGSAGVTVSGSLSGDPGFMIAGNYTSFSLAGNGSAFFGVSCHPTQTGQLSATLSFTDGPTAGSVNLECNGIDSTVTVAPSQVNFASTLVGRPPPQKMVQIGGNPSAVIESVTLDSNATGNGVSLVSIPSGNVGSGQTVVLAYDAAVMHAAGPLGTLAIKFDVDSSPRNVNLSGEALLGGIGTNPASVEFGAVCVDSMAMKDVEVFADEAGDIMVNSLTKPAAPFDAMAADTLPKQLMGLHSGPSVMVRASMKPTTPGDFRDALALETNIPNKGTTEVQLHGIALSAGIAATPNVVHFGTTAPGTTTSIKEIQLTNCGSGNLDFTRASITGGFASEFTLIGTNPPRTLLPTESEVFMVVMQPDTAGYKTAQLVIEHSNGTTTADLDGTGEGDGNIKDRETYYACSTGRGAALWPIALALVLLRRRRRA